MLLACRCASDNKPSPVIKRIYQPHKPACFILLGIPHYRYIAHDKAGKSVCYYQIITRPKGGTTQAVKTDIGQVARDRGRAA